MRSLLCDEFWRVIYEVFSKEHLFTFGPEYFHESAVLNNTLLSSHLVWPWWRPWQWQYEGVTNFLNILPQPMMIATRAWWTATTKLSSNGISLMVKHDISSISSFYSTAIFKMAYFLASKRTRTSLVFKKDRKGNRLNQHWSICEASQQGKNMHFLLWVFYNPSCTSFIPQMLTVLYTLQSAINEQWADNQLWGLRAHLSFMFWFSLFLRPSPLLTGDHHIRQYLVIVWKEMCLNVCMFAVYSMYFKCIFTVRPPCQEDPAYCWSACSLRWYPAIRRGFN